MRRYSGTLLAPFVYEGRLNRPAVVIWTVINVLVLFNALLHHPKVSWDGPDHLVYAATLADGRLPVYEDTHEFFSPPLPYLGGAAAFALSGLFTDDYWLRLMLGGKAGQVVNVAWSLLLTWFLARLVKRAAPDRPFAQTATLALLLPVSVYFQVFAAMRGEGPLAALTVVAVDLAAAMMAARRFPLGRCVVFGLVLGLLALSRQWAAFVGGGLALAGIVYLLQNRALAWPILRGSAVAAIAALVVAGPFYLHLTRLEGSPAAFNRIPQPFAFSNQPASFYVDLGLPEFFTAPVRPAFFNSLLPRVYSTFWGDWTCYWTVCYWDDTGEYVMAYQAEDWETGLDPGVHTNKHEIAPYLGRVNAVALGPTAVMLAGVGWAGWRVGRRLRRPQPGEDGRDPIDLLVVAILLVTAVGYLVFLIKFPRLGTGNTVKAGYVLHAAPLLALAGGLVLSDLLRRWRPLLWAVAVAWTLVVAHNGRTLFTHHPLIPGSDAATTWVRGLVT